MSGFRARDADRNRVVELIEAAFVDGQLGAEDRELRVTRALSAATRDELEGLTRDLRVRPDRTGAAAPVPSLPRPANKGPRTGSRTGLAVAAVVVAAVAVLGAVPMAFLSAGSSEYSSGATVDASVAAPAVEEVAPFRMTPADVRRFLRAHEQEFGTLDSFSTVLHPTRVSTQVPVRGSRPRAERWSYDGTWRQDSLASAVVRPGGIVDLGSIDVRRLFANIARARRTLDVQDGELTQVGVRTDVDGAPTLNIYIGNAFNESGHLMTTMSGEVLRRFPHTS